MCMTNVTQLKVLKLSCKNNTKHFKVICIWFSQNVKMQDRNGTNLPLSNWFGSRFWNDSPFVLLWATSASKIRCKVPLYVTVKGHWERSATFTARLHCNSGITSLHTIYRRIAQTDSPNTHWVYCYLMDRGVCLVFCVFFFFTKENYNCVTAHPETGSASESWSSMGRQV